MSAFQLADTPRSLNGGAVEYTVQQIYPKTTNVIGRPGRTGSAQGITQFFFSQDNRWWVPSLSYFDIRGHFSQDAAGTIPLPRGAVTAASVAAQGHGIAYCDNWPSSLFSQIQCMVNGKTIELLQFPAQSDTAALYASCDRTWLKSFGTASGVGESLSTRLLNSCQSGPLVDPPIAGTPNNEVIAAWRPALSLFDVPTGLPPGALWEFDFSWAPNGEQAMIESVFRPSTAGTNYFFTVDVMTFYVATMCPDPSIEMPMRGLIELNPIQSTSYTQPGGTTARFNVQLVGTVNRMLVVLQDGNTTNGFAAGQNGLKPITSFAASFSNGATDLASTISTFYVSLPELGMQWPNPTYNLGSSKAGWEQVYSDFIHTCRGASGGYEGSVPAGSLDTGPGAAIIFPGAGTVTQFGDPNNDQQLWLSSSVTIPASTSLPVIPVPTSTFANQTALWGFLGRCPGPIFAVPIVRPPDKMVTNADINITFTGNGPTNVVVTIIQIFSMALVCESNGYGKYSYEIVRGL